MQYVLFGASGLRVSELCLGTMTFGEDWGWGASEAESRKIFQAFVAAGGNFIDTANNYTNGTSERYVGALTRSERDQFVIATKYTLSTRRDDPNASGNHRKSMHRALEASLRRLGTDYVDLYWLHAWDYLTPVDEVMRALDDLVRGGKVLYLGVSDTPAWRVAQMNVLAQLRGWTPFVGLQVEYSLAERTPERELLPMARGFEMAVAAWSPLAGGLLSGKYATGALEGPHDSRLKVGQRRLSPQNLAIAEAVDQVARNLGRPASQVALSWLRERTGVVIPIIGARRVVQLEENLACLELHLSAEQLRILDEASRVELGFPHDFLASPGVRDLVYGGAYDRIRMPSHPR